MNKKLLYISSFCALLLLSCKSDKKVYAENIPEPVVKKLDSTIQEKEEEIINQRETIYTAVINFDEENFDFRDLKKGDKVTHTFSFTNTGNTPLIISDVRPSCGCTTPSYTKEPVTPGKKGSITVVFDSSNFEGYVLKTVLVTGNFKPKEIKFKANILK